MAGFETKFTIILPTQHRITVKLPSKDPLIRQVIEEACKRKNLDPDQHNLKRNGKVRYNYSLTHNRKRVSFVFFDNQSEIFCILILKVLDGGLSIRYANVPNLAELEMVQIHASEQKQEDGKPIKLAIQPDGGQRIICEHSPTTNLAEIVAAMEIKGSMSINSQPHPVTKKAHIQ